jgi:hypothetical protein
MKNNILIITLAFIFSASSLWAQKTNIRNQPEELGMVSWHRNYDEAKEQANKLNKPIFILFQEVPGCATCRNYGNDVLSHPLIVDAIENEFIPLAIYNNVKGHDRDVLNQFNEPTWNNPVVRVVDSNGKGLVSRLNGNYTSFGLVNYMLISLAAGFHGQPEYLKIAAAELETGKKSQVSQATYSMYCFWSGEAHLGQLDGVVATEPGFMNGKEVVRVTYNNDLIDEKTITSHAQKAQCSLETQSSKFKADKDPQYYLKQTNFKYLALTPLQKTKINSALKNGENASTLLSPSQSLFLTKIQNKSISNPNKLYEQDFKNAWQKMVGR